jgi:protocatechuate 3,4-dioxygenase beta subunit
MERMRTPFRRHCNGSGSSAVPYHGVVRAAGLLVALFLQVTGAAAPQSAAISGHVTDKGSGQPLPRIVVTLSSTDRARQVETLTDKEGRYEFAGLTAGTYAIEADNDDHVATYLRQSLGADVELAANESRTNVDVRMTRALGIEGRVFDPQGEPLRGANVSATYADGTTPGARSATTDDLGGYRLFGLRPGRYSVCAAALDGPNTPAAFGVRPVRTCYPDMSLTSQDSFNIDIHMQPGEAPGASVDASNPLAAGDSADFATIRGVVIDKESARPIPRAVVHLGFQGASRSPVDLAAETNADGTFAFTGLPPGRYQGFANASGHVPAGLTDRENGSQFTVQKGETVRVSAGLPRAYALNVRLVDTFDMPISGIGVSVRSLGGTGHAPFTQSSDDLGRVRLGDLAPGRYIVCAEPGGYSVSTQPVRPQKRDRLLRSCYPSASDEVEAQPITLGNADLDDLEIRMGRGHTPSISGMILDASGAATSRALVQFSKYTTTGMTARAFEVHSDGRFEITNVQPGAYAMQATGDREAAFVPIRIDEADIENLVVAMRKTMTVTGRITVDDPSTALPRDSSRAPVVLSARLADDRLPNAGSSLDATANSDGTFTLEDMFGRRRLEVRSVPSGWYVKTIRYNTNDVTDQPIEFKDDGGILEIVLSNRGATLGGTVAEVVDKRMPRAQIFLFRASVIRDDPPRLAASVTSISGNYTFGPLREGDYFIVAVPPDARYPRPDDWAYLAQLAALGERVTVAEQDQRTVDLHVVSAR